MKRYAIYYDPSSWHDEDVPMAESDEGEWVKAEDALALQETLMQLLEEQGLAHNKIMGFLRQMENAE